MRRLFLPSEHVLEQETAVFKSIDDAVYGAACAENEERCAALHFRQKPFSPALTPLLVLSSNVPIGLRPTIDGLASPLKGRFPCLGGRLPQQCRVRIVV